MFTFALRFIYAALLTLFAALAWEANDRAARIAREARAQEAKFMDQSQQLDAATARLVNSVKSEIGRAVDELAAANARTNDVDLQPMIDRITSAADSLDAAFPTAASSIPAGDGAAAGAATASPTGVDPTASATGSPAATSGATADAFSTPGTPADASPAAGDSNSAALGDSQADASAGDASGADAPQ